MEGCTLEEPPWMVGLWEVGELFSLPSSEVCEDVLRSRPGKLLPSLTKVSRGQLLTFKEALEGQVLDGWRRDRRTIVHVTVDNYGPPAVPTPPAIPTPPAVPRPPAVLRSSSSSTTDRWPYHGFIRSSNLAQTCDCCSIPISCKECLVAGWSKCRLSRW